MEDLIHCAPSEDKQNDLEEENLNVATMAAASFKPPQELNFSYPKWEEWKKYLEMYRIIEMLNIQKTTAVRKQGRIFRNVQNKR